MLTLACHDIIIGLLERSNQLFMMI